jgi:hypothetical protein
MFAVDSNMFKLLYDEHLDYMQRWIQTMNSNVEQMVRLREVALKYKILYSTRTDMMFAINRAFVIDESIVNNVSDVKSRVVQYVKNPLKYRQLPNGTQLHTMLGLMEDGTYAIFDEFIRVVTKSNVPPQPMLEIAATVMVNLIASVGFYKKFLANVSALPGYDQMPSITSMSSTQTL